jgi:hypothetical protein
MTPVTCSTRGASFKPGEKLPERSKTTGKVKVVKAFDKKAWHARKAAEAKANAKQNRQIETCYKQHVPPQVQYAPVELTERERGTARLMSSNRAVGM